MPQIQFNTRSRTTHQRIDALQIIGTKKQILPKSWDICVGLAFSKYCCFERINNPDSPTTIQKHHKNARRWHSDTIFPDSYLKRLRLFEDRHTIPKSEKILMLHEDQKKLSNNSTWLSKKNTNTCLIFFKNEKYAHCIAIHTNPNLKTYTIYDGYNVIKNIKNYPELVGHFIRIKKRVESTFRRFGPITDVFARSYRKIATPMLPSPHAASFRFQLS